MVEPLTQAEKDQIENFNYANEFWMMTGPEADEITKRRVQERVFRQNNGKTQNAKEQYLHFKGKAKRHHHYASTSDKNEEAIREYVESDTYKFINTAMKKGMSSM